MTKKLNRNKASAKSDVEEVSQPDNNYPDLQAFFETDVTIQSVTDVPVDSVKVRGARRRSQGIEVIESVPPSSYVVQVQTVPKALGPIDIERLSQSSAQVSTNNAITPEYAFLQNHPIWAKNKDDCGFLTGVEPVKLTGTPPPVTKQYPISKEAIQGIKPIVERLLKQGVLVKTNSPCNSPLWPIKKSNGTWRLTIDYRVANKHIDKITP